MAEIGVEGVALENVANVDATPKLPPQLLIVVGEAFSEGHREAIIQRLVTELSAWDNVSNGCVSDALLASLADQQPEVSSGVKGEFSLHWKSDSIAVQVLINPRLQTALLKLRQFLSIDTSYRGLVYSGHAVTGCGSWLLQGGPLRFTSIVETFHASGGIAGSGPVDVRSFAEGEWLASAFARLDKRFRLNPQKGDGDEAAIGKFVASISSHFTALSTVDLLQSTDVIGVVPFRRPTAYVFEGADGASMILGICGFTLLVDGGYNRRSCFWEFARHLDRIDSMVVSHVGADNVLGVASFVDRLARGGVETVLGQAFFNAGVVASRPGGGEGSGAAESGKDGNSLLLSLADEGSAMVAKLHRLKVPVVPCAATAVAQPINLYYKIGFGALDMYVLTPMVDSRELKEFLASWGKNPKSVHGNHLGEQVSVGFVVVFKPAARSGRPVRVLYPGSAPQSKILEGLDRLKAIALFQTPDGLPKPAAAKEKPVAARPGTGAAAAGKPADAKPLRASATPREPSKVAVVAAASAKDGGRKPIGADSTKKVTENRPPRSAASHPNGEQKKSGGVEAKEPKASSVATSTPKKDAPKPAPPKVDISSRNGATSARGVKKPEEQPKKEKAAPKTTSTMAAGKPAAKKAPSTKSVEASKKPAAVVDAAAVEKAAGGEAESEAVSAAEKDVPVNGCPADAVPCGSVAETSISTADGGDTELLVAKADIPPADCGDSQFAEHSVVSTEESIPLADGMGDCQPAPPVEADFNPAQHWDIPQSLPAPADRDGEVLPVESTAPAVVADPLPPATDAAATVEPTGPVEPVQVEPPAAKAAHTKDKPTTKRLTTAERLNQTVAGKPGSGEVARSANAKNNRQSLQSKDAKPLTAPKSAADHSVHARLESAPKTATAHAAPVRKPTAAPTKPVTPFYVDLVYVPTRAADVYTVEYFQHVRARNYVFAGASTDPRILAMLVDAKSLWDADDVTVIPTGDADDLIRWVNDDGHSDRLAQLKITVAPSVNRSSLHLENGSTCAAVRIEF